MNNAQPRIPEHQWFRIAKSLHEDPTNSELRLKVEGLVAIGVALRTQRSALKQSAALRAEAKKLRKIASLCDALADELDGNLYILTESFAFPPEPPWNGFQILRQQLPRLSYHARMLSPSGRSGVKSSRDLFWGDASRLYRKTTGKRQTVSVGSETSDRPGVPYGPFVDFIQAITIAAGEPEPTPEQIRSFVRFPARLIARLRGSRSVRQMGKKRRKTS
jgi:hypothetical protein